MSLREEQCKKVCRILDDVLANRPTERDSLIVAVRKAFKALEEPHWIKCSERLPETDMYRTLTTIRTPHKGTNVRSGHFYKGFFCNDNGDTWNATDKEVLAWMPLPEPYKGVTE